MDNSLSNIYNIVNIPRQPKVSNAKSSLSSKRRSCGDLSRLSQIWPFQVLFGTCTSASLAMLSILIRLLPECGVRIIGRFLPALEIVKNGDACNATKLSELAYPFESFCGCHNCFNRSTDTMNIRILNTQVEIRDMCQNGDVWIVLHVRCLDVSEYGNSIPPAKGPVRSI